ncbi:MAG: septum formation initiator family protein [Undibacterium sp.]|nr:septum formation initiator family protein [Opitutaceae bacterium]
MNLRHCILYLYLALIVGIGVAGGLFFLDARAEYTRLTAIQAENKRRVAEAETRLKYQEQVLERMRTDPAYLEKVIRSKLGYTAPNEFKFRFSEN